MGSTIPLAGAEAATLRRPFWLPRLYLACVGRLIERWGVALAPRPSSGRQAFIALADVAEALLRALDHPLAHNAVLDLVGPERLSWREVAATYSRVLKRPVRVLAPAPAPLLRLAAALLRPFSEAGANQLAILWALSRCEPPVDKDAASILGLTPMRAEEFLRAHAGCTRSQFHPAGVRAAEPRCAPRSRAALLERHAMLARPHPTGPQWRAR